MCSNGIGDKIIGQWRYCQVCRSECQTVYSSSQRSGDDLTAQRTQGSPTATPKKATAKHFSWNDSLISGSKLSTGWAPVGFSSGTGTTSSS
mmetsp:Transcript_37534/g.58629  ORF Transcript_37534/g.58629 Transcript_37534/m.58629 type:complete len:91 (-) Transcript_37534:4-276(-)